MTQDEIIRMALEVGVKEYGPLTRNWSFGLSQLKRFAALVAAHERERVMNEPLTKAMWDRLESEIRADEREACAKVCEDLYKHLNHDADCRKLWPHTKMINDQYAAAIRARNNND